MKTELPKVERMTECEKNVVEWAFNFAHSIVAGDYHLPSPMCYTMNNLQDAVHALADERKMTVEDGCSTDYLAFNRGYWDGVEERLRGKNK